MGWTPGSNFNKFMGNTGQGVGDLAENAMSGIAAGMDEIIGTITEAPGELITKTVGAVTDSLPTILMIFGVIILAIILLSRMFKVSVNIPGLGQVSN